MSTKTKNSVEPKLTRGQKLWDHLLEKRKESRFSLWRARLLTVSWKETEGLPQPIRRAKAFEKILTEIPIFIDEGQLLPGDFAASTVAVEFYPETAVDWMITEIVEAPAGERHFYVAEEDTDEFMEICQYWKDKNLQHCFLSLLSDEEKERLLDLTQFRAWVHLGTDNLILERGYICSDTPKIIKKGLLGVIAEVEEELAATPVHDHKSFEKANFIKALRIALEAGIQYGKRYAALARELAKRAKGDRKLELERMAEACEWVPANPARSFYEALLSAWFLHVLLFLDTHTHSESFGRMDQYLYPFYKRDIEDGKLTREEAIELLECLRIKCSSFRLCHSFHGREGASGELQFHNITLGGQTSTGQDATNELSYLFLEAGKRVRTPHPTLSVRMHDNIDPEFAIKAAEVVSLGVGYPAFFGDKGTILFLVSRGVPVELARDYALGGCVQPCIVGQFGYTHPLHMSAAKCFELALYDGFDPRLGKQLGPKTGKFEDFKTYDDVVEATKKQLSFFANEGARFIVSEQCLRAVVQPVLISSAFNADCIKRGENMLGDGGHWQFPVQVWQGIIDIVNSLAAIKKCVFEDGSVGKKELMDALAADFEGERNEEIRRILLAAPKYGNDDDYADRIAADFYRWYWQIATSIEGDNGWKFYPATYSSTLHGAAGTRIGALPSGRKAWAALADGSVSPSQGTDKKGPTAVVRSAGKIDQPRISGTLMNMKFHPSALKTREDYSKFIALIKTYFAYNGLHIQFNVINRETLLGAQAHPEQYRNLVIRVAGFSAYFVELTREIQDEIISRTPHTLS